MAGVEAVVLGLCDGCGLHAVGEHWDECGFVDFEFEFACDVGVSPKLVQFLETCFDGSNSCCDVCEGAAVVAEGDT